MYGLSNHAFSGGGNAVQSSQPILNLSSGASTTTTTQISIAECGDARPRQGGITVTFPMKLHTMLTEISGSCSSSNAEAVVIGWNPEGDAFVIANPKTFTQTLLPRYFRTNKFSSFQRQLNAYGFVRGNLYAGQEDMHIYYHDIFHRDHFDRIKTIKRRGSRSGKNKQQQQQRGRGGSSSSSSEERTSNGSSTNSTTTATTTTSKKSSSARTISIAVASPDESLSGGHNINNLGLLTDLSSGGGYVSSGDSMSGCCYRTEQDKALDEAAAAIEQPTGEDQVLSSATMTHFLSDWNPDTERLSVSEDEFPL